MTFAPHHLGLPPAGGLLDLAAAAVRAEHRKTTEAVRMRCRGVKSIGEGRLYRLDVGAFARMDWTWEGARALGGQNEASDFDADWSAEVVEVDEDRGFLFVNLSLGPPPTTGRMIVQPFAFLAALRSLHDDRRFEFLRASLEAALGAAQGDSQGQPIADAPADTPLGEAWRWSWATLWGPPGTGKTWTIGRQVAAAVADPSERVLVVSTTNKATDGAAVEIGVALRDAGFDLEAARRVGSGADIAAFERLGLAGLLAGGEAELRRELSALRVQHARARAPEERARLRAHMDELRKALRGAGRAFVDARLRVVVSTAFSAVLQLAAEEVPDLLEQGQAPFTTVILDEAGLLSRAKTAALSLMASRRVLLVGDPRQLAPITRMSRVLPSQEAAWLSRSGLSRLRLGSAAEPSVLLLDEQYRMCPQIRAVVSGYRYEGALRDAAPVLARRFEYDRQLEGQPRVIWYVLDDDLGGEGLARIRASRGPGGRSWSRLRTVDILADLLATHPRLRRGPGMFLSPFLAQTRLIRKEALGDVDGWTASTVHSQQGAQADYVIFDTVHAGSAAWPGDEWQRLVNVGLSRARQLVVLLASRDEMDEPFLAPLRRLVTPMVVRRRGRGRTWVEVPGSTVHVPSAEKRQDPSTLGAQLEQRKALRPVLSAEQQRLCGLELDGGPRLVRGVAGSGKTLVLANWLAAVIGRDDFAGRAWVVYANAALRGLLMEQIEEGWRRLRPGAPLPHERIDLWHVQDLLRTLHREAELPAPSGWDYDAWSARLLERQGPLRPRCEALFADEAQDLGPSTLRLLASLVHPSGPNPRRRQLVVFYDNAQNVYGRATPSWADLGLDMRGRSTVMKESFRSTRPILEFALNVLSALHPLRRDADLRELQRRGLLEEVDRGGERWWSVRYCQNEGPAPLFRRFRSRDEEAAALAELVRSWIEQEGIRPGAICVLCNGRPHRDRALKVLEEVLEPLDARVEEQTGRSFVRRDDTVVVSTAHSFKGHEAEVVAVPFADRFETGDGQVLAHALYVALTRARSVLYVSALARLGRTGPGTSIDLALDRASRLLAERSEVADATTAIEDHEDMVRRLGVQHARWYGRLRAREELEEGPIIDPDGAIVAEPLFRFLGYACFGDRDPGDAVRWRLQDLGYEILPPGGAWGRPARDAMEPDTSRRPGRGDG